MCNGSSRNPGGLERDMFNQLVPPPPAKAPETVELSPAELQKFVGLWLDEKRHSVDRTVIANGALRLVDGPVLRPLRDGSFTSGQSKITFKTGPDGKPTDVEVDSGEEVTRLKAAVEWKPTAADLQQMTGVWRSEEADASFRLVVEGDQAILLQRPTTRHQLQPMVKDHFAIPRSGTAVWFTRDSSGRIERMHVGAPRMRDMFFERIGR